MGIENKSKLKNLSCLGAGEAIEKKNQYHHQSFKVQVPVICSVSVVGNTEMKIRPHSSPHAVDSLAGGIRPVYKKEQWAN